jgi:predicted Rossmann fold flavoprotein
MQARRSDRRSVPPPVQTGSGSKGRGLPASQPVFGLPSEQARCVGLFGGEVKGGKGLHGDAKPGKATPMNNFDVIILGAGAAGLMCALTAGQRGKSVLLLDHAEKVGKKILISGGGRCNFTNIHTVPERFISANPHFAKSALAGYRPADFIALVEKHRIAWHEKTLGQLFCDGSARSIVNLLEDECAAAAVDIRTGCAIESVSKPDGFSVSTNLGIFHAPKLVLATGGPSIPKMGATGFAYDIGRQFGLNVLEPRPGLVPLTFDGEVRRMCESIAGVAVEAITSTGKTRFREALLFTHRGLSGPAVLQISSCWQAGTPLYVDLLPDIDALAFLKDRKRTRARAEGHTVLAEIMPVRLANVMTSMLDLFGPIANIPDRVLEAAAATLKRWPVTPDGTEGFAKAEVTVGGIDTKDLSSKTMEARAVPGLHVIGEAVDVTGWLGGYNFQWAWASGRAAGNAV